MSAEGRSRFGYYGDEPTEGGVQSVTRKETARGNVGGSPGVPGPTERLLDISELTRTVGMRYTHRFAIPAAVEDGLETVTPIAGEVTLTNAGSILHLHGHAVTTVRLECVRCLSSVDAPVETELEENFELVSSFNAYHQEEIHAHDEDTPASVIQGNIFNLGELLRQNLILAAPSQPICREDCAGIVPGAFVTEAETAPVVEEEPPATHNPFQKLAALLEEKQRREENK